MVDIIGVGDVFIGMFVMLACSEDFNVVSAMRFGVYVVVMKCGGIGV